VSERRGHIKLSRKLFEDDPWWNEKRPRTRIEAWLDLIYLASWKPRQFAIGNEVHDLGRGEFVASLRFLAERWRWGKTAVASFLAACEKLRRIARQRDGQGGTVYLLVNYDYYQGVETDRRTPSEPGRRTPDGHLADTSRTKQKQVSSKAVKPSHREVIAEAARMWAVSRGEPPYARIGNAMKRLVPKHGTRQVLLAWEGYLEDRRDKGFCTPEDFAGSYNLYRQKWAVEIGEDGAEMPIPDEPVAA
jgi:hypothetical protein